MLEVVASVCTQPQVSIKRCRQKQPDKLPYFHLISRVLNFAKNRTSEQTNSNNTKNNFFCKQQPSSETQGQSVGSGERAWRKFWSTGERAPEYQISNWKFPGCVHFFGAWATQAVIETIAVVYELTKRTQEKLFADWAQQYKAFFVPNQEPASAWIFGNSSVRVGTQGLFRPYLKNFVPPFLPTRLTDCPWVSEDETTANKDNYKEWKVWRLHKGEFEEFIQRRTVRTARVLRRKADGQNQTKIS